MSPAVLLLLGLAMLGLIALLAARRWRAAQDAQARLSARLSGLRPAASGDEAQAPLQADWLARLLERAPRGWRVQLARAEIRPRGGPALAGLAVVLALTLLAARLAGPVAGLAALALGVAGPAFVINLRAQRRMARFTEELPYFLDALRQFLTIGNSFQQAFLKAVEAAPAAVRPHLAPAARRIRSGGQLPEALTLAAERIDAPELHMLTTAVRTNLRFGGALGPLLTDLIGMLRDRARIGRELKSATAETRLSGAIISALPLVALALLAFLNFDYVRFLWETPQGRNLLMVGGAMQLVGMAVMRQLMRVDF